MLTLKTTSALSRQRRRPDRSSRMCHQRSMYWSGRRLRYCHSSHIRKVRSITTGKGIPALKAHSRTDTPGYRKYSPYSSLSAPLAATSILHCNLSVRRAQSQPIDAPSLRSSSLSLLVSVLLELIFTFIIVRYFGDTPFSSWFQSVLCGIL